jgi:hypothetical protein
MSLTLRTPSPTPAGSGGPRNNLAKVQQTRANLKTGRTYSEFLTKKITGKNAKSFQTKVISDLTQEQQDLYNNTYLVSYFDRFFLNKKLFNGKDISTEVKNMFANNARNDAAKAGNMLCASLLTQAVVGGAVGAGLIAGTAGAALPALAAVAMVAAICREKYVRFQAVLLVFNVIYDEIQRMQKIVEAINKEGWDINCKVFNESVFDLFTYISSLTTADEISKKAAEKGVPDVSSKLSRAGNAISTFINLRARYFNPFEIAVASTEKLTRVTTSFSIVLGEYTMAKLGVEGFVKRVAGSNPQTVGDMFAAYAQTITTVVNEGGISQINSAATQAGAIAVANGLASVASAQGAEAAMAAASGAGSPLGGGHTRRRR